MEEAQAEAAVRQLVGELRDARETLESAQRSVVGIRKLIDGYVELFPLLEEVVAKEGGLEDDDGHPRGMDAAFEVLRLLPGKWQTVGRVAEALESRGWGPNSSNPANAVRTALERLYSNSRIEKAKSTTGQVIYRWPDTAKPVSAGGGYDDFADEPF